MSDELQAFKQALNEAGQPWSRWGVRCIAAGIVGLVVGQVAPFRWSATAMVIALAVVVVGWGCLIAAAVKRRRWAKAQPLRPPELDVT